MKSIFAAFLSIAVFCGVSHAQTPAQRRAWEIQQHNFNQYQAAQLLFSNNGLPALQRPANPWNYGLYQPQFIYVQPFNNFYSPYNSYNYGFGYPRYYRFR